MAGIFPFMDIPSEVKSQQTLGVFRELAWDFDNNKLILIDGAPVTVERTEALKVWIYKTLSTPRYRYAGYSWNYGTELEQLIGSSFTSGAKQAEAERMVREALLVSPYITGVANVSFDIETGGLLKITAMVNTIYGEVAVSV
ncbi:DUF2634 domain-containing protein [Paenibacillus whitsoniae]|uniref:DUF2634 domain-containing protein n=1 Tax=Paenibacillus whitsoniae TaxID=2496558 RepID=A0A430J7G1_9BACL|nr:DUF2634 domain-containing protein [Paenibacillus whitsoniae]RTE05484.1 DUF2634 domain-containing protein [Paenibacillus whitsoniae]